MLEGLVIIFDMLVHIKHRKVDIRLRIQTKIINFICNRLNSGEVWVILGKLFE